ncbi:hypothetical protein P0W64_15020 [Tsukamurella sp. 8F]|uniref:hypothetical protein n=1 Tax=unclassified Tsukamurella TaxID=2633480 RepID=UPI0023B89D3D|nr:MULTISPECIES: hypothetical protein [unclassified Tsukamurella]MDF0532206.1 hypothetical protein [Tsukamurella sp. 8J]MDF0588089.1 hypothetical protein [Tsukamurella sp. 8F]
MDTSRSWFVPLAGPVTAASIAAAVALGLALAGPGRYFGWRLQKVLDLLDKMKLDQLPELAVERRELCAEARRLSKRVAAYHRVPTEWSMYALAVAGYGIFLTAMVVLPRWKPYGWLLWSVLGVLGFIAAESIYAFSSSVMMTREERFRFVREGMPDDFRRRDARRPAWLSPKPSRWEQSEPPRSAPTWLYWLPWVLSSDIRHAKGLDGEEEPQERPGGSAA